MRTKLSSFIENYDHPIFLAFTQSKIEKRMATVMRTAISSNSPFSYILGSGDRAVNSLRNVKKKEIFHFLVLREITEKRENKNNNITNSIS